MKVSGRWIVGMLATVLLMGIGMGLVTAWTVGVQHYKPPPKVSVLNFPLHPQGARQT